MPNILVLNTFSWLFIIHLTTWCRAELYTAISDVEPLLETHKRIIDDLDDYVEKEEKRLMILKKHLNLYRQEHIKAMEDIPNYLGNPINAFTLIKRLTTDLDRIDDRIRLGTEYTKNLTVNHEDAKYPGMEDLTGAAQALMRLKETYSLDIEELARGLLNGVNYSTPMTTSDCFELGRALYNVKDYEATIDWMKITLDKYKEEKESQHFFEEVDILEYISFSYYVLGDVKSALEWTKKLLVLDPAHPRARDNVPHYEKEIADEEEKAKKRRKGDTGEDVLEIKPKGQWARSWEKRAYETLCRGEMQLSDEMTKMLKCRYMTENHPFLKLAPLKVEQMYIKPDIYLFHQVISDEEIELVKQQAKPKFRRAVVHDPRSGQLVAATYRISKSAWLRDADDEFVARLSRRVADISGLSLDTAEELQVVNYGIGGHYEPHYDFALRNDNTFSGRSGNRIATVMFYMSEVAQGGATVFTELGLSVFPVKNAAIFWMNLHPSGEGDLATRHAACPVLRGSKWVCNKWFHEGGQEFLKPCTLEYQEEGIVHKLQRPVPKQRSSR